MKIAVPIWNGRVSPVFDTAQKFVVIEMENGKEVSRENLIIPEMHCYAKARRLRELAVEVVICGAISNHAIGVVCANGIKVIPWISGDVEDVVESFKKGSIPNSRFAMPGCRRRGRRLGRHWARTMRHVRMVDENRKG